MLDSLITSKTRVKLLLKFFANSNVRAYLRKLAVEFNESTNSVRIELSKLTEAGILESEPSGNTIMYRANKKHPLFPEITKIVEKYFGFDQIIEKVLSNIGELKKAFVIGDYAEGKDTGTIQLVLVGDINEEFLQTLIEKAEEMIKRKLNYTIVAEGDYTPEHPLFNENKILLY